MKTIKTPKKVHNRPYHGPWYEWYSKDERKARRRLFKAIRHKLLFCIPLTEEEKEYQKKVHININSPMTREGRIGGDDRWIVLGGKIYRYSDETRERIRRKKKR